MTGSVRTIFEQYTTTETPLEATEPTDDPRTYRAHTIESRRSVPRMRIYYQDGKQAVMAYAYLVEAFCSSHQFLSLVFTHCVLTLEGRHLDQLIGPLQDEKIRALHCFHAGHYDDPAAGAPVILRITRQHPHEVLNQ